MEPQAQATEQAGPPPQAIMMQMSMGAMVTQAIFVAAKLRIADIVADGEKHIDEIATEAEAHSPSLYRILRTLASLGVFNETQSRTFANTPLSEVLRADIPGSMRNSMIFMGEPWHYNTWSNMLHSAKTGGTAWKETYGEEVFDWFPKNLEASEIFNGCSRRTLPRSHAGSEDRSIRRTRTIGVLRPHRQRSRDCSGCICPHSRGL